MATLIYFDGKGAERRIPLRGERVQIGRSPENDLSIQDPLASRKHCVLEWEKNGWTASDLESRYGTVVNETPIDGRYRLKDGDRVRIGGTVIRYVEDTNDVAGAVPDAGNDEETTGEVGSVDGLAKVWSLAAKLGETLADPAATAKAELTALVDAVNDAGKTYDRKGRLNFLATTLGEVLSGLKADPDRVLQVTVDLAIRVLQAERGYVLLKDGDVMTKVGRDMIDLQGGSATISEVVAREGTPILTIDAQNDIRFKDARSVMLNDIRAVMCVPVRDRTGASVGAIYLDGRQRVSLFDADAVAFLEKLARHSAEAHEAALRRARESLESPKGRKSATPEQVIADLMVGSEPTARIVTLLSLQISGFDTMLDELNAPEAVRRINEMLSGFHDDLLLEQGTLDRYTADGFLAVFGAPRTQADQALRALRAATKIRLSAQGKVAIGIHCGRAVIGNVGSARRMEFAALGPAVRISARVLELARPGEIVVTRSVLERAGGRASTNPLPLARLHGVQGLEPLFLVSEVS